MVSAADSGPDWATIMTALGTVGAVVAAAGSRCSWIGGDRLSLLKRRGGRGQRRERTDLLHASMPGVNGPDTAHRSAPPRATRLHVIDVTQMS